MLTDCDAIDWICGEAEASQENDDMKTQIARYLKEELSHQKSFTRGDLTIITILRWCFKLGLQNVFQEWLATAATEIPLLIRQGLAMYFASDSFQAVNDWESW